MTDTGRAEALRAAVERIDRLERRLLAAVARAEAAEARVAELEAAIRGYVEREDHRTFDKPGKVAKCKHGCYTWEECAQCNSEWFMAALAPTRAG